MVNNKMKTKVPITLVDIFPHPTVTNLIHKFFSSYIFWSFTCFLQAAQQQYLITQQQPITEKHLLYSVQVVNTMLTYLLFLSLISCSKLQAEQSQHTIFYLNCFIIRQLDHFYKHMTSHIDMSSTHIYSYKKSIEHGDNIPLTPIVVIVNSRVTQVHYLCPKHQNNAH